MLSLSILIGTAVAFFGTLAIAARFDHSDRSGRAFFFFGYQALDDNQISLSLFSSWMSVGNVIVGALILTVYFGYVALWAILTWVLGFLILRVHAAKIVGAASSFVTLHKFLHMKYQHHYLEKISSLLTVITACGVIALELLVGSALFRIVFGNQDAVLTTVFCTILFSFIAVRYIDIGGLQAVIGTDRYQSYAIMVAVASLVALTFLGQAQGVQPTFGSEIAEQVAQDPYQYQLLSLIGFVLGFGALQLFLLLGDMMTWQRIQLGANRKVVRSAALKAAGQNFAGWFFLFVAGMFLTNWDAISAQLPIMIGPLQEILATQAEPLNSIMKANYEYPILSLILISLISFGLISAVLSTCDSFLLTGAQAMLFSWTKRGSEIESVESMQLGEEDWSGRYGRRLVVFVLFASWLLFVVTSLASVPLVALIFLLLSVQTALAPITVAALYYPNAVRGLGGRVSLSLCVVLLVLVVLFGLSGSATSLSLSYAYSYAAPIVAILIPLATLFLSAVSPQRRVLRRLWLTMAFGDRREPEVT